MEPQSILVIVVALVMGWFAFGILYNLRHGDALLKWMKGGLPRVGERVTYRWLGSSVAELGISQAKPPLRSLQIMIVLSPRDVPWLWLPAYFRGRRDTLIFRAQLTTAPRIDMDWVQPAFWTGRMAVEDATEKNWLQSDYRELRLLSPAVYQKLAVSMLEQQTEPMQVLSPVYHRFSLRRDEPHLEVHLPLPDYKHIPADQYFKALQDLAQQIAQNEGLMA